MPRSSFQKQRRSIATAESVMGTAGGEERLGITWVSKHPDSEDESVRLEMGWDGLHRAKNQRAYNFKGKIRKNKGKKDGGAGPSVGWQDLPHARLGRD